MGHHLRVTDQELWVPNPNSADFDRTTEYGYDSDGLITSINTYDNYWNPVAPTIGITYDPSNGLPTNTSVGNVTTSQDYDSSGALSYFETDYGGSSIFQTSYQRDSLNRISILTEVNQGQMTVKKYAYDIVGRLSQVWRNDTLISTYSYDPNGNRIARCTPSKIDSGFYDAQDRMLSYGNAQYIYSRNGELQKKISGTDTTSYAYDYFGNLLSVRLPGHGGQANGDFIEYIIDGQNRRIGKKINGAIVKKWIYAGGLSPIAELDSAYNVTAEFVGSLMIKNGNTYQLITDHLGSVRLVVDINSGNIIQQLDYDEFGNVLSDSNPDFQPFAYAGGLYDSQTKLVRFGARDYDASSGRWTCKDPIGFHGKQANVYGYIIEDPINSIDQSGKIKLHTKGATNQQIETYSNSYLIAYKEIANNQKAKEFFSRFGINIMDVLSPGQGPDLYLDPQNNGDWGWYDPSKDEVRIFKFCDEQSMASTIVHELAHWARTKGIIHDPDMSDIKFNSPNPNDPPEGYAAEMVVFGLIY
jgi:RHS repeat-associated protein